MKCVRCGNSKKLFEKFTSYGFCQKCHQTLKADIESRVSKINRFIASVAQIPKDDLSQKVDYYLKEIASLEELRAKVPMFKSSLTAQLQKLIDLKSTLQPSVTSENTDNQSLIIPEKIDQYEVRYLYQDVWVVGTQYATPDFSQLQLRQQVTLVPDPTNEHDTLSVKIMCNGQFIGYLPENMDRIKSMVYDWHKKSAPIFAGIVSLDHDTHQVNIVIAFYMNCKELLGKKNNGFGKTNWTTELPDSYVVIDLETTGLKPNTNEIVEIAAIKYESHAQTDIFHSMVKPIIPITEQVSRINGITNRMLENAPSLEMIIDSFFDFIGDYTLIAHNARFDINFLQVRCLRQIHNEVVDTLKLSRAVITGVENHKLETLKNHLNLTQKSHRATDDCLVTAQIYQHCLPLYNRHTATKRNANRKSSLPNPSAAP